MTGLSTRAGLVAGACLVQAVLVPAAVWPQLSARVTGQEYLLEVAPLDPIDPFRGAYVTLDYPGLATADSGDDEPAGGTVYYRLVPDGEVWVGDGPAVVQRPESGPYLSCVSESWRTSCGIESFFAAQEEALRLEQELAQGGALARVRIDGRGNAAVVGIEAR